ncbi:MAG TPA: 50S ribosomal protein L25 [Solirubrobacteraceae bacterium]|jgi:large subunit ribosomal protein L25
MASSDTTALKVSPREAGHSRATRRLRRAGEVPGVVYGGGEDPVAFQVGERTLRHALQDSGAVMQLEVEGGSSSPVVVKELVRHPVTGLTMHLDLLRVRMDVAIQSTTTLELTGSEDAPGVREGGVLELVTRELAIEALPGSIPDTITYDVSSMQIGDTLTLEQVKAPSGVTLLDDPETVVATLTPPRLQAEADEGIEAETEVVGEGEAPAEAEGDESGDAGSSDDGDSE